ncbi:MAG: nicotinate-nicotinamide nucleotide adenylyltransferase [Proteobacteria bacterium]|nr:nicotinate-nicotinamide nucleotide adenylyltransferase [Pseudomonadota bacterium]
MIVGILGGTFDPPHLGHLGVAAIALASDEVDEVWFVPCLAHRFGKEPRPFEDRLAMCRLLTKNKSNMKVSDIESTLKKPGYTFDLVLALRAVHPDKTFRLLVGTDIYHERDKWHLFDEIVRLAPPLYVARDGVEPIPEPTLAAPVGIRSSELRKELARGDRPLEAIPVEVLDYIEINRLYSVKP